MFVVYLNMKDNPPSKGYLVYVLKEVTRSRNDGYFKRGVFYPTRINVLISILIAFKCI